MEKRPQKLLDQIREAIRRKHYSTCITAVVFARRRLTCRLSEGIHALFAHRVSQRRLHKGAVRSEPCSRQRLESLSVEALTMKPQPEGGTVPRVRVPLLTARETIKRVETLDW